jgi:hypothetical protein
LFDLLYRFLFFLDVYPDLGKKAHIYVRDESEREKCKKISPPVVQEKRISGNDKDGYGHIMAETIFTGKKEKELPAPDVFIIFAPALAVFVELAEKFFVRYRPRDAGYRYGKY